MTDHSLKCPSVITSNCSEGVFYDDNITNLGVDTVQGAIEALTGAGGQGAQGAQGAQGNIGAQGPGVGVQGAQGPVGAQGIGAQGPQGTGVQGAQGSIGAQGPAGAQGSISGVGIGFEATNTTSQSIPNDFSWHTVIFTSTAGGTIGSNDPASKYDINTGIWICPLSGYWDLYAQIGYVTTANGGDRALRFTINGISFSFGEFYVAPTTSTRNSVAVRRTHARLSVNDTIRVQTKQTSGAALNIDNSNSTQFFGAAWAGAL